MFFLNIHLTLIASRPLNLKSLRINLSQRQSFFWLMFVKTNSGGSTGLKVGQWHHERVRILRWDPQEQQRRRRRSCKAASRIQSGHFKDHNSSP